MKHTSVSDLEHFLNNLSLEDVEKTDNLSDKDINEIDDLVKLLNINDKVKNNNIIERCSHYNDSITKDNSENKICVNVEWNYEKQNKILKALHITSKIIRFFKEKKINYTLNYENDMMFIIGEYNTKYVNIELKIDVNMKDSTFNYSFTRKLVRNCRYDPYNNGVRKFQGTYKGKFTENEINHLMNYIK